jgi:hypothetical protein
MKNEKTRMHNDIRVFGGENMGCPVEAVRDSCLSIIRYAKKIKRTGQVLRKY